MPSEYPAILSVEKEVNRTCEDLWVVAAAVSGYCWGIGVTCLGAPAEGYRLQRLCRRTEWNRTVTMEMEE